MFLLNKVCVGSIKAEVVVKLSVAVENQVTIFVVVVALVVLVGSVAAVVVVVVVTVVLANSVEVEGVAIVVSVLFRAHGIVIEGFTAIRN